MVQATVVLRVDVDTRQGLEAGVPRLLELFRRLDVRASFFVTMGPDRSGVAIRRIWRPSFIRKMLRTRALRLYGLRTVFSGTLLPAAPVGAGSPALLRQIAGEGHEVGPHGFDHVGWQDGAHRWSAARIRADMRSAAASFEAALGVSPQSSAAPGWRTTPGVLVVQEEMGYRYAADVRGTVPFWPEVDGVTLKTLQIPTTMPTMDELLGRVADVPQALEAVVRPGLNVFTLHAEVEGGALFGTFHAFVERVRRRGLAIVPLRDVAAAAREDPGRSPSSAVVRGRVQGRSGWVAAAVSVAPC